MDKTFHYLDNKIIKLQKANVISSNKATIGNNLIAELDDLKKEIIKIVYSNNFFGKYRSLISLEEFYCNPYKESGNYLKVFNNNLIPGTTITGNIQIIGIWYTAKSFGVYCKLENYHIIKNEYNFIEDESDSDIEAVINQLS